MDFLKRLGSVLVFFILVFATALPALASEEVGFDAPNGFVSATVGEDYSALADALGKSETEIETVFKENGLIQFAVDLKHFSQITLAVTEDEFSRSTVSFSRFSQDELTSLADGLVPDDFTFDSVQAGKDGLPYLKFWGIQNGYRITEYLTVSDAGLYTLNIVAPVSAELDGQAVFGTLTVPMQAEPDDPPPLIYTCLTVAGIVLAAAVIAYLGYTVIRDIKRAKA